MSALIALLCVMLSTAIVAWFSQKRGQFDPKELRAALRIVLEIIGACFFMYAMNLIVGAALLLTLRSITDRTFVALYALGDPILLSFATFQGLFWVLWKERSATRPRSATREDAHD